MIAPIRSIAYRATDFITTREELLRPRTGEVALLDWHPDAESEIALQLVEWWAYLADILAFYNERALHESYLRSAVFPEDVRRIVRLLGYRPRPGIGATGVVAALTDSAQPFVIPRGFPLQGEAPDGSQIFESDEDVEIGLLGKRLPRSARFPAQPGQSIITGYARRTRRGRLANSLELPKPASTDFDFEAGKPIPIPLNGVIASVKPKDVLMFLPRALGAPHIRVEVRDVTPTYDEFGVAKTTLTLVPASTTPARPDAYRLVRPTQTAHLWTYHFRYTGQAPGLGFSAGDVIGALMDPTTLFGASFAAPEDPNVLTSDAANRGVAHLEAIVRGLKAGDEIVFEKTENNVVTSSFFTHVHGYSEMIWYANAPQNGGPPPAEPKKEGGGILGDIAGALSFGLLGGDDDEKPSPIPIPHTKLTFMDPSGVVRAMGGTALGDIDKIVVHYGWEEVGQLIEAREGDTQTEVQIPATEGTPPGAPVLIEDTTGIGFPGFLGSPTVTTSEPLQPPLIALLNLIPLSRGESVRGEVLGSGDRTIAGQELVIRRSPVTYHRDTSEDAIDGYRSTLRIHVDGIEWREVASLYKRRSDERVFVTWEDEEQKTHVKFGDGELGARLPTGVDNVIANYRVGSGAATPGRGSLTTMLRPQPGITEIRNPVAVGGGADPDPPEQIRKYAPLSVLTFGRAISGDDYEAIAAQTPGVRRAKVEWGWDAETQRSTVRLFVGDDSAAVVATREALIAFADPNRPFSVELASPVYVHLDLVVEVHRDRVQSDVGEAVRAALLDPQAEPFGIERMQIGGAVYNSQVYRACLRVPGVVAVHSLRFATWRPHTPPLFPFWVPPIWGGGGVIALPATITNPGERHAPGPGRFYMLHPDALNVATEAARHGV